MSFRAGLVGGSCELEAFTGPIKLEAADPVKLHFDLVVTPNKPVDTARHFQKQRYYQMESQLVPAPTLLDNGIRIANVHQGNELNPWIIYPLDPVANGLARDFADKMHAGGSKVKTYYSSGSLSFITPELWAFFSLYGELLAHPAYIDPIPPPTPPPYAEGSKSQRIASIENHRVDDSGSDPPQFGPHHWFAEHAATALFSSDWTTPLSTASTSPLCDGCDMDVSFTTRANSRLANFWSRLLLPATEELQIDGIYLDGVAYDAPTMLRAMRAVSAGRGRQGSSDALMDLHCGNRWPSGKGEIDVLEYAQHMSLMDSVMFGEGFDDGGTHGCPDLQSGVCGDADWMLLATSGLQFGVMNDMLTDINVHRGMVFGMWARPPYSSLEQNHQIWEFFDSSGLADNRTEMIGFWADEADWHAVATTSHAGIKATAYVVQPRDHDDQGHVVIALASWAASDTTFTLSLNASTIAAKMKHWGNRVQLQAPAIPLVQNGSSPVIWDATQPSHAMQLAPRAGILLTVRQLKTDDELTMLPLIAGATPPPAISVVVTACDATSPTQRWDFRSGRIYLRSPQPPATAEFCLEDNRDQVYAAQCGPAAANTTLSTTTVWRLNISSHEIAPVGGPASSGQRLDVQAYGYNGPGSPVDLYKATGADNQKWRYEPTSGQIVSMQTAWKNCTLCLDAVEIPLLQNPCAAAGSVFAAQPWCNASLGLEARVADAVARLSTATKLQMFASNNPALPALGLPPYIWGSEASTGVASGRNTQTTKFAFPITTAMAFNRTLWSETGRMIGREARAMMNQGNGYSTFWAPVINLVHLPTPCHPSP